jgi:type IV secretory pathway VirB10-like protein
MTRNRVQTGRKSSRQAGKPRPCFAAFKGLKAAGSNPLQKHQPGEGEHVRRKNGHLVSVRPVTNATDSSSSPPHPVTPEGAADQQPPSSTQPQSDADRHPAVAPQQRTTARQQARAQQDADREREEQRKAEQKERCASTFPYSPLLHWTGRMRDAAPNRVAKLHSGATFGMRSVNHRPVKEADQAWWVQKTTGGHGRTTSWTT